MFRVLWVLWGSLLMSLCIYGSLPFVLPVAEAVDVQPAFVIALGCVALATAFATVVVRRRALTGPAERGEIDFSTPEGMGRFFSISILLFVLSESIGVYGLVLFFLTRDVSLFYPLLLMAGGLFVYHAPRPIARARSLRELARPDVKIG